MPPQLEEVAFYYYFYKDDIYFFKLFISVYGFAYLSRIDENAKTRDRIRIVLNWIFILIC